MQRNTESFALGQRLRACRRRADVSVGAAAKAMGISTDAIHDSETRANFAMWQIKGYCNLYRCTPNDIFGFDAPLQSDTPEKWLRLHLDGTPKDGQLCQLLVYSDDLITIDGNVFCSVRTARWQDGRFVSAVNDQVPLKDNLIGWLPLPEPPDGYTATLSRIDDLKGGERQPKVDAV